MSIDLADSVDRSYIGDSLRVILKTKGRPGFKHFRALKAAGAKIINQFFSIDAFAVEVPASAVESLLAQDAFEWGSPDREVKAATQELRTIVGVDQVSNYKGDGIGIAFLDSGVYSRHVELDNFNASINFASDTPSSSNPDAYGHGTHVAQIALGDGTSLLSGSAGIAPMARIIDVRVLDALGRGNASNVIAGIDWCIQNKSAHNIRVMNLSLGSLTAESYTTDPLCQAVERAVRAGIVVVCAAGNAGKDTAGNPMYGTIDSPGIDPMVITVGAANNQGTLARSDDTVAGFSSRGPTYNDRLIKPDLIAPGCQIVAAESDGNYLVSTYPELHYPVKSKMSNQQFMYLNGTSMATPVVSGAVAMLLQRNPNLSPSIVKAILQYTAQPLPNASVLDQGAGQINVEGAMRLAAALPASFSGMTTGSTMIAGAFPAEQSTIAGQTCNWFGGIYGGYNHVLAGRKLFTEYQKIYDPGFNWAKGKVTVNGTLLSSGTLLTEGTLLCDGVILRYSHLAQGALLTDSTTQSQGTLLSNGVLVSSGVPQASNLALPPGITLANGMLLADSAGVHHASGTLLSSTIVPSTYFARSNNALVVGEAMIWQ